VSGRQPSPVAVQLARLLDGLCPGQDKERYRGWGREMRDLYGGLDPAVLRGAVTRYLALETALPRPAAFAPYVTIAQEAAERARRLGEQRLPPPPPPPPAEAEARRAQSEAAKEAARASLPPHLRKRRPGTPVAWRVPGGARAAPAGHGATRPSASRTDPELGALQRLVGPPQPREPLPGQAALDMPGLVEPPTGRSPAPSASEEAPERRGHRPGLRPPKRRGG
jgi:hypothetical protein